MPVYLGVDGGQSSTTALIGDEAGRVLGRGRGGPCNHAGSVEGREKFNRAMRDCLGGACTQAGLDPAHVRFAAACLGLSGGPEDKQAILREILRAEKLILTIDAVVALSGATAGQPGIITIAGTGSIAFGRNGAICVQPIEPDLLCLAGMDATLCSARPARLGKSARGRLRYHTIGGPNP